MIQKGLFRVCFQPITMLNCCTTCISWEIGSYNTQQSRHNEHTHFCREIRNMIFRKWGGGSEAVWNFSKNESDLVVACVPMERIRIRLLALNVSSNLLHQYYIIISTAGAVREPSYQLNHPLSFWAFNPVYTKAFRQVSGSLVFFYHLYLHY